MTLAVYCGSVSSKQISHLTSVLICLTKRTLVNQVWCIKDHRKTSRYNVPVVVLGRYDNEGGVMMNETLLKAAMLLSAISYAYFTHIATLRKSQTLVEIMATFGGQIVLFLTSNWGIGFFQTIIEFGGIFAIAYGFLSLLVRCALIKNSGRTQSVISIFAVAIWFSFITSVLSVLEYETVLIKYAQLLNFKLEVYDFISFLFVSGLCSCFWLLHRIAWNKQCTVVESFVLLPFIVVFGLALSIVLMRILWLPLLIIGIVIVVYREFPENNS